MKNTAKKLTTSAVLIALSTVLAIVCGYIPFLNLPFGGGFTIASMLPIIVIAYMFGIRWGFFCSFLHSVIQLALGAFVGSGYVLALFSVNSDDFMGYRAAVFIVLLDYLLAYTVLGIGGIFRNSLSKTPALILGSVVALSARYLVHIVSGYIFFGTYAEWFFSQEGFYAIGNVILSNFSGAALGIIYSVFYNGLYMIPEIVITAVAALAVSRIPAITKAN